MNIKKELGEKIKRVRKSRGITQEQLAEMIDISPRSLSNIEVGGDYTLHYELLESTLSDTSILGIGTTWNVTQNGRIFDTLLSAEVGTPVDIPFHCYQAPDSKANKLIYIQFSANGVADEYIKFKCYVKA